MNLCPKCGKNYTTSHIEYVNGNPIVINECVCGYSSKNDTYTTTDRTNYEKESTY